MQYKSKIQSIIKFVVVLRVGVASFLAEQSRRMISTAGARLFDGKADLVNNV